MVCENLAKQFLFGRNNYNFGFQGGKAIFIFSLFWSCIFFSKPKVLKLYFKYLVQKEGSRVLTEKTKNKKDHSRSISKLMNKSVVERSFEYYYASIFSVIIFLFVLGFFYYCSAV